MKNYLFSMLWLISEKGINFFFILLINFEIAKYLGPSQFGELNLSQAFTAILLILSGFGFHNIILREYSRTKVKKYILEYSIILRLLTSFVIVFVISILYFIDLIKFEMLLYSIICIPQSFFFFENVFQAQGKGKVIAVSKIISIVTSGFIKLTIIHFDFGFHYLIVAFIFESFFISVFYVFNYNLIKIEFKFSEFVEILTFLLKNSMPLLFSGLLVILYTRTDQFMINMMIDNERLGYYSAAIKISEVLNFLPYLITSSFYPYLVKVRDNSYMGFEKLLSHWIRIAFLFSLSVSFVLFYFSDVIINTAYGDNYAESIDVLRVLSFSIIFISIGAVSSKWLLVEELQKFSLLQAISGALTNIVLNIILIPILGILGASIATVISLFMSSFVSYLFVKQTRKYILLFFKAIFYVRNTN